MRSPLACVFLWPLLREDLGSLFSRGLLLSILSIAALVSNADRVSPLLSAAASMASSRPTSSEILAFYGACLIEEQRHHNDGLTAAASNSAASSADIRSRARLEVEWNCSM